MTAWEPARVISEAQQALPAMLADTRRLVETESPSGDLDAVGASAAAVAFLVEHRLGVRPELVVRDGVTHVRLRAAAEARVLLLAHHDTVWPVGSLKAMPFRVGDGAITGPGCFDMKVGLVQAIHALALARDQLGDLVLSDVELLVTGDEEVGSATSRDLIEADASGVRAVLVLEGAAPGGAPKVARKGAQVYRLKVTGRAAHAGLEPEAGINAGVELANQIVSVNRLGSPAVHTTVTPTTVSVPSAANTVPATGELAIDVRAWTSAEQTRVDAGLRRLSPFLVGARLELEAGPRRPPLEPALSGALLDRWNDAAKRCGLPAFTGAAVGGASDGNFTAGLGIATLDGLGAAGAGAHAAHERVELDQVAPRTGILATLIADLLTYGGPDT